jgi:hypothetical protein
MRARERGFRDALLNAGAKEAIRLRYSMHEQQLSGGHYPLHFCTIFFVSSSATPLEIKAILKRIRLSTTVQNILELANAMNRNKLLNSASQQQE